MGAGLPAVERSTNDVGMGMLFVSEMTFTTGGTVSLVEVYTGWADPDLLVHVWRQTGNYTYDRVGAIPVNAASGYTFTVISAPFEVLAGDLVGWYSPAIQPIQFDLDEDNATNTVRRSYGYAVTTTSVNLSHHTGWIRDYSVRVSLNTSSIAPTAINAPTSSGSGSGSGSGSSSAGSGSSSNGE